MMLGVGKGKGNVEAIGQLPGLQVAMLTDKPLLKSRGLYPFCTSPSIILFQSDKTSNAYILVYTWFGLEPL